MQIVENTWAWIRYWLGGVAGWLLNTDGTGQKLLLMLFAVALFAGTMFLVLFLAGRPRLRSRWWTLAGFLGPALVAVGFGLIYPAIRTVILSFGDRTGREAIGFENYLRILTEPGFQVVLRNTAAWVLLVPLLATLIGLVYAVLIDNAPFERGLKTLVFMPMAISMVGASIIWRFMYEYRPIQREQTGLLNQLLVLLGLEPQQFLLNAPVNNVFLMVVMIWIQAGFAMTVLSAAIKAIPRDIVEAARLDGVSAWQMFWQVTIPAIRPSLVVVITTIAMATLKVFDIVRTMTGGNYGTSVVANEFYTQSFTIGDTGMGSALAVVLFILVVPIVVFNVLQMRKADEAR